MIKFILENFDTIFKNENSLETLNKVILDLAIRGKLVPQNENDEPAGELLKRIQAEKERLIKEKVIKKEKSLPEITEEEIPFDIPKNWEVVRMNDIGNYRKGPFGSALTKSIFVPKGKDTVKVYEQKNAIQKNHTLGEYYITKEYFESKMKGFEVNPHDIIVSCAGTIGETYVLPENIEKGIINQALMRMKISSEININFFLLYFDYVLKKYSNDYSKGSAIKNIPPFEVFKNFIFLLPPLEEQKRIVEKVEKLQEFIKNLKDIYSSDEKNRNNLKKSLLTEIEKSSDDTKLLNNLELVFNNFDKIVKTKEDIKDIRNLILSLAIKGKLVPQNENDEPTSELLKRIQTEKERLIQEKVIKKEKTLPPITEEEIPFDIPKNWELIRIRDTINIYSGLSYNKKNLDVKEEKMITVFRGGNITERDYIFRNDDVKISHTFIKNKELFLKKNQLITPAVTSQEQLGKMALIEKDYDNVVAGGFVLNLVPIFNNNIYSKYLLYILSSQIMKNKYTRIANKSGQAFYNLSREKLGNLLIPVPPLEEQKRIVEKIENLMEICNLLEEKIDTSEKISENLLKSFVNNGK